MVWLALRHGRAGTLIRTLWGDGPTVRHLWQAAQMAVVGLVVCQVLLGAVVVWLMGQADIDVAGQPVRDARIGGADADRADLDRAGPGR